MAGCRGSNNTIPVCSMGTNRLCMPVSFPPSDKTSIGGDIVVSRAGGFHVPVPHPAQERKFHILELQRDSCALAWASGNPDWVICPPSSISPGTEGVWLSGWQGQSLSLCYTVPPALSWLRCPCTWHRWRAGRCAGNSRDNGSLSGGSYNKCPALDLLCSYASSWMQLVHNYRPRSVEFIVLQKRLKLCRYSLSALKLINFRQKPL